MKIRHISGREFAEKYKGGKLGGSLFLDVREPEEWRVYHLPGSIRIPLGSLPHCWRERLDCTQELYVFCAHGVRSLYAVRFLADQNRTGIVHVDGGLAQVALYLDEQELPPARDTK